ncbi:hypothetical protein SLS60_001320 [Paraconiothyrium brasiliense]|uniref:Uncharacterized protein n=1 Tax=Paraconiothyrium brasiliense TaxID=300254 RepID=A0ABR3S8R5_9PLEO
MCEPEDLSNDFETYVHNFGEPQPTIEKLEEIAAKSLSHDGSSSHHSLTERTTTQAANPSANVDVEEGYYSVEIPDHVDWRAGYGRRKTQDFGFPGARIKPGSTFQASKAPLQDRGVRLATALLAAEKLNVGAPGQLGPNMNDTLSWLLESVKSAPELVDLVKSAADDLGIDLDQKYTAEDDAKFEAAPMEHSPKRFPVSRHSSVLEPVVEKFKKKELHAPVLRKATSFKSGKTQKTEDAWLQNTRKQLTQLSETQSQLMDELDIIVDDLGVYLDRSSTTIDPGDRAPSRVSANLSRNLTRFRNKSVDSVFEEVPRMIDHEINKRRLSNVFTCVSTQSRRMSRIPQGVLEIEAIPPEEIQAWLECAEPELTDAIDSSTAVMGSLPAVHLATTLGTEEVEASGDAEEQPQYAVDFSPELRSEEVKYREERAGSPISLAPEPDNSEIEEAIQIEEQPDYAVQIVTGLVTPELEPELDYFQRRVVRKVTTRRRSEHFLSPEPEPETDTFRPSVIRKTTTKQCTEATPESEIVDFQVPVVGQMIRRRLTELGIKTNRVRTEQTAPGNEEVVSPQCAATSKRILERQPSQSPEWLMVERVATCQPTELEKKATRKSTEQAPPKEEQPLLRRAASAMSRQSIDEPTRVERKVTPVPSERAPSEEDQPIQRYATGVSHQGTPGWSSFGFLQRNAEPEIGAGRASSPSTQFHVLDEPLAVLDIYHGRLSTVGHVLFYEETGRIQDEPTAFYTPTAICSSQPSDSVPEWQPTTPSTEAELVPNETLVAPLIRVAERPTLPTEENLVQEPSRLDRPSAADFSRGPQSLTPLLERVATAAPRCRSMIPRVLTVVVEKQRKPSSAAPGIVAPPTQYAPKKMMPTARKGNSRISNYGVNLPPDQQRPPAPEYPVRDTPRWTKPDTHTPPPKPKQEPMTKSKAGVFGFGSKPKADPQPVSRVQRNHSRKLSAQRDHEPVRPFRSAAPGYPGGTLQRPRGYPTAPGRYPISLARRVAPPVFVFSTPRRRGDPIPQQAPSFARKDDYYLRVPPLLSVRRASSSRRGAAPVRRDFGQSPPSSSRYEFSPPAYRQRPSRQSYPSRNEVNARPLCSHPSKSLRYQPQSRQDLRDKAKAVPTREAPPHIRRTPTDKQPSHPLAVPQEANKPELVRRDAQCGRTMSRTSRMWAQKAPSTKSGNIGRQPTKKGPSRVAGRRASHIPEASAQRAQGEEVDQRLKSSAAPGSRALRTEESSHENLGPAASESHSWESHDLGLRQLTDGTSEESSKLPSRKAYTERTVRARTTIPRASTFSALDAARRISAAGHALKLNPDNALLKPLSPVEAARTISAAGHRIKQRSSRSPDGFQSSSTTPRAGTPKIGTPQTGASRTQSRGCKLSRATTSGHISRRASAFGEEGRKRRTIASRHPSTAAGTRSPRSQQSRSRSISDATRAIDFSRTSLGDTTLAPSGPESTLSEVSSTRVDPESFSRVQDSEQGVQKTRTKSEAATEPSRTPISRDDLGGLRSRNGNGQLQSPVSEQTQALIQQHRRASIFSRETSRADVPRSQSLVRAADDSRSQFPAQQRADAKRRNPFAASPAPQTDSPTTHKSFWGRRDKSELPPWRDRKDAGGEDKQRGHAREGPTGGIGQTGQDDGGQRKGCCEESEVAVAAMGQRTSQGLRRKLFRKRA